VRNLLVTTEYEPRIDVKALRRNVLLRVLLLFVFMGLILFLPAGTLAYWQAWVWLTVWFVPVSLVIGYYLKADPALIERRIRIREKEKTQRNIMSIAFLLFIVAFLIPGFDKRYGWSSVPVPVVLIADCLMLGSYLLFVRVLKENRYASRTIEVVEGQRVITTGPYAIVRHPMYVAALGMYLVSPLALGSYWALPVCMLYIPVLVVRIVNEEKVLRKELDGYAEYLRMTRFRLIPNVW
jgi:protein-S-isoprenylcysteine O-methyltransferase Ste14